MISINTNLQSQKIQTNLLDTTKKLNLAIERLTTGCKINQAKDNAANYSIAQNMSVKINAYQIAQDNAAMGLDLVNTASDSLEIIGNAFARIRALAEQSLNGTYGTMSKQAINSEVNALIDRIVQKLENTEYNDIKVFKEIPTTEPAVNTPVVTPAPEPTVMETVTGGTFISNVTHRDTSSMTALADVNINTALTSGTYSISTAEELGKLSTMTNNGLIGSNTEFVLANNIDMGAYCASHSWTPIGWSVDAVRFNNFDKAFKGTFDGNGCVIKNLSNFCIEFNNYGTNEYHGGLFGFVYQGNIKNLGIEGINETVSNESTYIGVLALRTIMSAVDNCYAKGNISSNQRWSYLTGLIGTTLGNSSNMTIKNCYTDVNITINSNTYSARSASGIINGCYSSCTCSIENCYSIGNLSAFDNYNDNNAGSIAYSSLGVNTNNCYYIGDNATYYPNKVEPAGTSKVSSISQIPILASHTVSWEQEGSGSGGSGSGISSGGSSNYSYGGDLTFQIGINSSKSSQVSVNTAFSISNLDTLRNIGLNNTNYLSSIDTIINNINGKQTLLGACQNRLESALESITTNMNNLISSHSTLKDADIAKISSQYIQQQILQQAAATLLSTANQQPSIALQLI